MTSNQDTFGKNHDRLFVIFDGHALFYRAFHAIPSMKSETGEETAATFGVTNSILKTLQNLSPKRAAVAFDMKGPTFRHKSFENYKANRPPMPEEMRSQFTRIRDVINLLGLPIFELAGFEADDILGYLSTQASKESLETIIVSGDQDTMQLVSPNVNVLYQKPRSNAVLFNEDSVKEKYGLYPNQIPDLKALMGDSSDNIPGLPGIGSVTATKLLQEYNSINEIYEKIDLVMPKKVQRTLIESEALARQCLELTTIVKDLPIELNFDRLVWEDYLSQSETRALFTELNFKRLLEKIPDKQLSTPIEDNNAPIELNYSIAESMQEVNELLSKLKDVSDLSIIVMNNKITNIDMLPAGIAFSWGKGQAAYIPIVEPLMGTLPQEKHPLIEEIVKYIGALTNDQTLVLHTARDLIHPLNNLGIQIDKKSIWDISVAAHLLGINSKDIEDLINDHFAISLSIEELLGKGKKSISFSSAPIEQAAHYASSIADYTLRIKPTLAAQMETHGSKDLFESIEMPLATIMTRIEKTGMKLDSKLLNDMEKELTAKLGGMENKIFTTVQDLASLNSDFTFNINSSKQVAEVLYEKIGLPSLKKTRSGSYSTDATVLKTLSKTPGQRGDLVSLILDYRELSKLLSTYLTALPAHVNIHTKRIHTSLNQVATSTGRIASSDPNLQQIPIRTETGNRIRKAFIPENNSLFIGADYSQVELRILAHLSNDQAMKNAFASGEDIHSSTASAILEKKLSDVTSSDRRIAKAINFGIVYGMSGFGLSTRLDMERSLADEFISNYFKRYPKVKDYMESTIENARSLGYVETLLGRRRYLPEITSSNSNIRTSAERMAINMPVQGTAGDLIKLAMIQIQERLDSSTMSSKMVLQIHDELLFESPLAEKNPLSEILEELMPQALPGISVPLLIDIKTGPNWGELT
jgi:DNA polymerase-1